MVCSKGQSNIFDIYSRFFNALAAPLALPRLPLSGDVEQQISPSLYSTSITNNFAGNLPLEMLVTARVASYGKQLGWLGEIVLAMAKGETPPEETVRKLSEASAHIERIKQELGRSAADNARDALDRLQREAPEEFRRIVTERYSELGGEPGA